VGLSWKEGDRFRDHHLHFLTAHLPPSCDLHLPRDLAVPGGLRGRRAFDTAVAAEAREAVGCWAAGAGNMDAGGEKKKTFRRNTTFGVLCHATASPPSLS